MTVETAPRPAVAEPTTPIRPSEALRLGRLIRPRQHFGGWYYSGKDGSCAMGAILDGGGGWDAIDRTDAFPCPVGCVLEESRRRISHLNDDHHWSDTRIVAWLESLGL